MWFKSEIVDGKGNPDVGRDADGTSLVKAHMPQRMSARHTLTRGLLDADAATVSRDI
jgi:hypothetical protein